MNPPFTGDLRLWGAPLTQTQLATFASTLEDANLKLSCVLSDVFGVNGQRILRAVLEGERDVEAILKLTDGHMRRKLPQLRSALEGHRFADHHRLLVQ